MDINNKKTKILFNNKNKINIIVFSLAYTLKLFYFKLKKLVLFIIYFYYYNITKIALLDLYINNYIK